MKKESFSIEKLTAIVEALREFDIERIGVGHCTGMRASKRLMDEFGDRIFFNAVGMIFRFWTGPSRYYASIENRVLWAISAIDGSASKNEKTLNPKHEIRNPKWFDKLTTLSQVEGQYLMTKIQMAQTKDLPGRAFLRLFLSLGPLIFEFVSDFDIRISNFTYRV